MARNSRNICWISFNVVWFSLFKNIIDTNINRSKRTTMFNETLMNSLRALKATSRPNERQSRLNMNPPYHRPAETKRKNGITHSKNSSFISLPATHSVIATHAPWIFNEPFIGFPHTKQKKLAGGSWTTAAAALYLPNPNTHTHILRLIIIIVLIVWFTTHGSRNKQHGRKVRAQFGIAII